MCGADNESELYAACDLITGGALECLEALCNNTCQETENVNKLERILFIYLYPFIALLCLVGNSANLIVYNHHFLRSSSTIRMLAAKAVANTLNILSLLPMHISSLALLSPEAHDIPPPFYWYALRYMLFFANVFSTIAIWLTAAVSIENCLLVVFPVHAKFWCTMRNACISILTCVAGALVLHSFNLIGFDLIPILCFDLITANVSQGHRFQLANEYAFMERVYYWCNAISTIFIPMVVMCSATVLIYYHLIWARSEISRGAEQKLCVVRLSFVTALCHVVFEMPHLGVLASAALRGSARDTSEENWPSGDQVLFTISNFLTQIDASIPFFVYFVCSKRFRQLCFITVTGKSNLEPITTASTATMSMNHRRSDVVLLNSSRLAHLPLSTFNDSLPSKKPPTDSAAIDETQSQRQRNEANHQNASDSGDRSENASLLVHES